MSLALSASAAQSPPPGTVQTGVASFYNAPSAKSAPGYLSMAHRHWALGTNVVVTNLKNRQSVCVAVTDRGPYRKGRIADLSITAAKRIGLTHNHGLTRVKLEVVEACP